MVKRRKWFRRSSLLMEIQRMVVYLIGRAKAAVFLLTVIEAAPRSWQRKALGICLPSGFAIKAKIHVKHQGVALWM